MASGNASKVIRAPGRLVVNPTTNLASGSFPYGGTAIGHASRITLLPQGKAFPVWYEMLGEIGDILEADHRWTFACFLRGWDDDALEHLFGSNYNRGAATQRAVFTVPARHTVGASALERGVRLAFVPDDAENVPALIIYRAVATFSDVAELLLQRNAELGLPLTFHCIRDDEGRILEMGRVHDLEVGT